MEATAIALSNAVDLANREAREKRYLEIVGRYDRDVVDLFPKVFGEVVEALEAEPGDVLGAVYGELEQNSKDRGQFFTPYPICKLMAQVTLHSRESAAEIIERKGFIRTMEPACGSGAMIIALAEAMRAEDINYQRHLHVTAVDIDLRAIHMAYIQFTLMHIPAVLVHGNSISLDVHDRWYTPAHILGGWSMKLARTNTDDAARTLMESVPQRLPEPSAPPLVEKRADKPVQLSLF